MKTKKTILDKICFWKTKKEENDLDFLRPLPKGYVAPPRPSLPPMSQEELNAEAIKAASKKHKLNLDELAKWISLGADVNAKGDWGVTLSMFLARSSSRFNEGILGLVKRGADVTVKDDSGRTLLHHYNQRYISDNTINVMADIYIAKGIPLDVVAEHARIVKCFSPNSGPGKLFAYTLMRKMDYDIEEVIEYINNVVIFDDELLSWLEDPRHSVALNEINRKSLLFYKDKEQEGYYCFERTYYYPEKERKFHKDLLLMNEGELEDEYINTNISSRKDEIWGLYKYKYNCFGSVNENLGRHLDPNNKDNNCRDVNFQRFGRRSKPDF